MYSKVVASLLVALISSLISCVQINAAVINLHNQYIRDRQDVLRLLSMNSGHNKVKKERTISEGDSERDQEGQAHGGTILSMAQRSKKNGERILECLNLAILVNTKFPVDAFGDFLRFVFFLDRQQ